jgi:hypothetical protein
MRCKTGVKFYEGLIREIYQFFTHLEVYMVFLESAVSEEIIHEKK